MICRTRGCASRLGVPFTIKAPSGAFIVNGAPRAIRTPDPQIRSLMLYPAELWVHTIFPCLRVGRLATDTMRKYQGGFGRKGRKLISICSFALHKY